MLPGELEQINERQRRLEQITAEMQAEEHERARAWKASRGEGLGVTPGSTVGPAETFTPVELLTIDNPCDYVVDGFVDGIHDSAERGDSSRKDAGKARGFYLIPRRPLAELARLYAIGADKYQPRGWEAGMEWSRIWDPMERHLSKWIMGERFDKKDGQHHLAAVAWACFALMEYELTHPELDDLGRSAEVGPPLDAIAREQS